MVKHDWVGQLVAIFRRRKQKDACGRTHGLARTGVHQAVWRMPWVPAADGGDETSSRLRWDASLSLSLCSLCALSYAGSYSFASSYLGVSCHPHLGMQQGLRCVESKINVDMLKGLGYEPKGAKD